MRWITTLLIAAVFSCDTNTDVILPRDNSIAKLKPISEKSRGFMDGYYDVVAGKDQFGEVVVLRWNPDNHSMASVFGPNNYLVLKGGMLDDKVYFTGYWRVPTSDARGLVTMSIGQEDGAASIQQSNPPSFLIIRGKYGLNDGDPSRDFVLKFKKKLPPVNFLVIGHRGGGRTSDRLPYSENSIELLRFASNLGANGVEVDARLTRDGYPVLYHDQDINIRLTTKGPINGDLSDYTWDQITTYVRLIRGEKIPKLEDALNFVIDSTSLRLVYIDMKDANAGLLVNKVIEVQRRAREHLRQAQILTHRAPLLIIMCIPTDPMLDYYRSVQVKDSIDIVCELDRAKAESINATVWSRPWTLGIDNYELILFKNGSGNRKTLFWTIDQTEWIWRMMDSHAELDGIITDYPSILIYQYFLYHM